MALEMQDAALSSRRSRLEALDGARRRGVAFLLAQLRDDGALGDPAQGFHFYRAAWTFMLAGETAAAAAVCAWIRRNMLLPDNTIGGPFRVFDDAYAYRDSGLIVGAHMAGQYDLSIGLMPNLLRWRDPLSGGFANGRLPGGGPTDEMDIWNACGPGFATLITGDLAVARGVADFLRKIYRAQPAFPDRLYYVWSRSRQALVTEFPPEEAFSFVVERKTPGRQAWFLGGIAAGFLCRLYLAEPKTEYLELARHYQDFSIGSTETQFEHQEVCKAGWGAALLYQITGERKYRDWADRMGDWYLSRQAPDGSWPFSTPGAEDWVIDDALQFVLHLDTIIGALASRAD